jgi:hypothetical protein
MKSGTVTTAQMLEIAVMVTESATSPRARCVNMFAVAPPGDAPSSTMPTASVAGRAQSSAIPKASRGEIRSRLPRPIATPFG